MTTSMTDEASAIPQHIRDHPLDHEKFEELPDTSMLIDETGSLWIKLHDNGGNSVVEEYDTPYMVFTFDSVPYNLYVIRYGVTE